MPPWIIDVLYRDLTPSLDLCNATDIKAKKIAKLTLRREQTRGKWEASAGAGAHASHLSGGRGHVASATCIEESDRPHHS